MLGLGRYSVFTTVKRRLFKSVFFCLKCECRRGVKGARIGVDVARRLAVIDVFVR